MALRYNVAMNRSPGRPQQEHHPQSDYSNFFARSDALLFLNAGSLTRAPLSVLEALEKYRREGELNPTKSLFESYRVLWDVQRELAPFFGADPKHLFFRANITAALTDFLFAVPLPGDGEILATGWEYGATTEIARVRAAQSGLRYREITLPLVVDPQASSSGASQEIPEDELVRRITSELRPDTRLLVVSHVATGNGTVFPIARLAQEAKRNNTLVVVDGAHAPGAIPLRLGELSDVDFYGGNLHKWFLGPRGTAFGWVNPRWNGKLSWKFAGWASRETPAFYQGFGEGDRDAAQRFPSGTIDPFPFYALRETLAFWNAHGPEELRARQAFLRDRCAAKAEALGWRRVSPRDPRRLGPLVSYLAPWKSEDAVALATRIYQETGVQLALPKVQGTLLVRFSPGVYGTEREIDEAFQRLAAFRV